MAIKKQEFYEGAALHRLVCSGALREIGFQSPFFVINQAVRVYLKYSTRTRSPWGFTFTADEQKVLALPCPYKQVIGLVCGGDGVAMLKMDDYMKIALPRTGSLYVSCGRRHGEHFEVNGPDGQLPKKISPSLWNRFLIDGGL